MILVITAVDIMVTVIGGYLNILGSIKIQIPFKDIHLAIDVNFLIFKLLIPTLFSLLYMMINGLYISLK